MISVQTAPDESVLCAARALLFDAFSGAFGDSDWEHTLGGVHALAWEGGGLVGHAAVVERRLESGGRPLRCGYVEGVGVRADRRGRGVASALMAAVEEVVRASFEVGALSATDAAVPLYSGRGWQRWRGPLSARTPGGEVVRTPEDDGSVWVLAVSAALDLDGELVCDWREGELW